MDAAAKEQRFLPPQFVSRQSALEASQFQKSLLKRHHLRLAPFAPFAPVLQLPFWLAFMESIRSMSGWQPGLLAILQQWFNPDGVKAQIPVEPSLSSQGALWFPDLMAADPLGVLPVAISVLMFTHITWGSKVSKMKDLPKLVSQGNLQGIFSWAIQRIFQAMSIWIAPTLLYSEAPAALSIYWLSTTCVAIVQSRLLKKYMPTPNVPKACVKRTIVSIATGSTIPVTFTSAFHGDGILFPLHSAVEGPRGVFGLFAGLSLHQKTPRSARQLTGYRSGIA
ncbi:mitochondrial export translocase Oxa2 [Histoplasma capsulatum H143]|uniref:Mitochondrial export translocase Oxa2 n=1 Tax=Ajellomyces capsulatus (strain H143) TaxID=544712 RepID=C6H5I6_AJECH|nr:mitochondrial export translocase Oxa2 [Histoplasma capsulatum H143]